MPQKGGDPTARLYRYLLFLRLLLLGGGDSAVLGTRLLLRLLAVSLLTQLLHALLNVKWSCWKFKDDMETRHINYGWIGHEIAYQLLDSFTAGIKIIIKFIVGEIN